MRDFRKVRVCVLAVAIVLFLFGGFCYGANKVKVIEPTINYGAAEVAKIVEVENGFVFRCDVKDWPKIIGEDIGVKIRGVKILSVVAKEGRVNEFYESQAKKFIKNTLNGAKRIRLENIARDKVFGIVANVIVDSNSLGTLMVEEGLADRIAPKITRSNIQNGLTYDKVISPVKVGVEVKNIDIVGNKGNLKFVASKRGKVFHKASCRFAKTMSEQNIIRFNSSEEAAKTGREACKICKP